MAKTKRVLTVFDQAKALQRKFAAIDRREEAAQVKLTTRFQEEKQALLDSASDAVLRILEAARGDDEPVSS